MEMDLEVAALFVGKRRGQLDQAAAAHHQQLGEFVLSNDPLLDERYSSHAWGHFVPDTIAVWGRLVSGSRTRRRLAHWPGTTRRRDRDRAWYRRSSGRSRPRIPRCLLATRRAPKRPSR